MEKSVEGSMSWGDAIGKVERDTLRKAEQSRFMSVWLTPTLVFSLFCCVLVVMVVFAFRGSDCAFSASEGFKKSSTTTKELRKELIKRMMYMQ